jgi:hypothetical protein
MGKITQGFVIAASSVVIAVGGVWLYRQYATHQAVEACVNWHVNLFNLRAKFSNEYGNWKAKTPEEKLAYWRKPCIENPGLRYQD